MRRTMEHLLHADESLAQAKLIPANCSDLQR